MEGGPPPGNQEGAWRSPTLGRARGPPGCPVGPLDAPLRLYLSLGVETPNIEVLFPEAIPISAAIANKLWGTRIPVPAPCWDGEVPPDLSPSMLLPPSIKRE